MAFLVKNSEYFINKNCIKLKKLFFYKCQQIINFENWCTMMKFHFLNWKFLGNTIEFFYLL